MFWKCRRMRSLFTANNGELKCSVSLETTLHKVLIPGFTNLQVYFTAFFSISRSSVLHTNCMVALIKQLIKT